MGGYFRIGLALVFGIFLVTGALFVRDHMVTADSNNPNDISNLVANRILREYQDPKDTDGDGRKDWEETLTGTNPNGIDDIGSTTASTTLNTGYGPTTMTQKFAVEFFDTFIRARKNNTPLSPAEQATLVEQTARKFANENTNKLYTKGDIDIVDNGGGALFTYANTVGSLVMTHNPKKHLENEAIIMKKAVDADKPELLADLTLISKAYTDIVTDLLLVPVPEENATEHVLLINSFAAVRDDVLGMQQVFTDPMFAYIRVKRYQDDVNGLANSIEAVRAVLEEKDLIFDKYDAGSFFFSLHP